MQPAQFFDGELFHHYVTLRSQSGEAETKTSSVESSSSEVASAPAIDFQDDVFSSSFSALSLRGAEPVPTFAFSGLAVASEEKGTPKKQKATGTAKREDEARPSPANNKERTLRDAEPPTVGPKGPAVAPAPVFKASPEGDALPIDAYEREIIYRIGKDRVTIIHGETGNYYRPPYFQIIMRR